MVGVDTRKLRLSIDHHEHSIRRSAANATYFDCSCSTVAHSEAEDVALGDEESGHHSRKGREQLSLACSLYLRGGNGCHRIGQKVAADSIVAARNNNLVNVAAVVVGVNVCSYKQCGKNNQ